MSDDHHVAAFAGYRVDNPGRRIGRLQTTCGGKGRERITAAPECLGRLPRAKLAAVPDDEGFDACAGRFLRQQIDFDAPTSRQRPGRIDLRPDCVAMMNEKEARYFETILRSVAAIDFLPPASLTSPVSVTVCDMCGTSFSFLFAASVPVTS